VAISALTPDKLGPIKVGQAAHEPVLPEGLHLGKAPPGRPVLRTEKPGAKSRAMDHTQRATTFLFDARVHFMDDHLIERVRVLEERVLMLEAGHHAPLSYVDCIIAQDLDKKRREPHEDARRRLDAFKRAEAEAERVGHLGPVDDFLQKLKWGEFDLHPRHNGGKNAEVHQRTS
jgi:hypothetical protein